MNCLVVGLDGSAPAAAALTWALAHLQDGGTIHAVHGISPGSATALSLSRIDRQRQRVQIDADLSGSWSAPAREAGVTVACHLVDRDPAGALLDVVAAHGADAIALGTHGASGRPGFGLGSVTRSLLHRADVPLIVVPATPSSGSEVVVGVCADEASRSAAEWAVGFAADHDRDLVLTRVLRRRPLFPHGELEETITWYIDPDLPAELAEDDLNELAQQLRAEHGYDRPIAIDLSTGSPGRTLVERSLTADLLVVGKQQGHPLVGSLVGPVVHHVLKRGRCPVAVIPSRAGA